MNNNAYLNTHNNQSILQIRNNLKTGNFSPIFDTGLKMEFGIFSPVTNKDNSNNNYNNRNFNFEEIKTQQMIYNQSQIHNNSINSNNINLKKVKIENISSNKPKNEIPQSSNPFLNSLENSTLYFLHKNYDYNINNKTSSNSVSKQKKKKGISIKDILEGNFDEEDLNKKKKNRNKSNYSNNEINLITESNISNRSKANIPKPSKNNGLAFVNKVPINSIGGNISLINATNKKISNLKKSNNINSNNKKLNMEIENNPSGLSKSRILNYREKNKKHDDFFNDDW